MEGRWIGGAPVGPPRASLQSKQQAPPQPPKDRESSRDAKNSSGSAAPSAAKGGPQGGGAPSGALRGVQSSSSKKSAAAAAAAEAAVPPRRLNSSSSGGSNTSTGSSSRPPLLQQLPLQTEEELLRGCGFQAIWSENFEVSGLMNAAVKICRLAPTEGDDEWQEAQLSFFHLLNLCWARLGRHQCLLQSRLQDVEDVLQMEEEIQARIELYKKGVITARGELEVAEMMQKRRKEVDAICGEVLKKPCLQETTQLEKEEADRRIKAETTKQDIISQIATKKRLVETAIKAAEDLFQTPVEEQAVA